MTHAHKIICLCSHIYALLSNINYLLIHAIVDYFYIHVFYQLSEECYVVGKYQRV